MIAASDSWEFIPRGRQAVDNHPGPFTDRKPSSKLPQENILLQRLQNVNISCPDESNEFWYIQSVYDDSCDQQKRRKDHLKNTNAKGKKDITHGDLPPPPTWKANANYMNEVFINSEEELYVKKYTAVWTRGMSDKQCVLPQTCLTCETPIKYALFCNKSLVRSNNIFNSDPFHDDEDFRVVCLVDEKEIHIYCSNGEDFVTNLEFPVSQVWSTYYGLLLEKVASTSLVQNQSIALPRLFSLSHPLNEICPVLNKSATSVISYLVDSDYTIVYTTQHTDLVLLYDKKIGKHYVSRLRKATDDEINFISMQNEAGISGNTHHHSTQRAGTGVTSGIYNNMSQNSLKLSTSAPKNSTINLGRTSLGASTSYSTHFEKFLTCGSSNKRNSVALSLSQLQSSMGHSSFTTQDLRFLGQAQPSKPIVPQLCLEHMWTENTFGSSREFCEISSRAFMHTDLVGQMFLCYLLPRAMKLQLVLLNNYGSENLQFSTLPSTIMAKDAITLERLRMIAVLDPSGILCLYSGTVFVTKVHLPHSLLTKGDFKTPTTVQKEAASPAQQVNVLKNPKSHAMQSAAFPRRSSLLPTAQKQPEASFDEELHMLSPVHPLQPQYSNRNISSVCLGIRDPANNRLTMVYPSGKMYRLTLPLFHDFQFVGRCIKAMRHLLTREQYLQLVIRFYTGRNPTGSREQTFAQEWHIFRNVLLEMMGFNAALRDSSLNNSSSFNAGEPKKRRKNDEEINAGSNDDWQLMKSLQNAGSVPFVPLVQQNEPQSMDTSACLFPIIPAVFYCLHLLYEDIKLDVALHENLSHMAQFLYQLALDMKLSSYTFHYALDYPELMGSFNQNNGYMLCEKHAKNMKYHHLLSTKAPNIFEQLNHILQGDSSDDLTYDYVIGINDLSRNVLQLFSLIMHGIGSMRKWIKELNFSDIKTVHSYFEKIPKRMISSQATRNEQVVQMLLAMELTREDIERLPVAVHLVIAECLEHVRLSPPMGFGPNYYALLLREELVEHAKLRVENEIELSLNQTLKPNTFPSAEDSLSPRNVTSTSPKCHYAVSSKDDGMDNVETKLLSLRYPDDMRITEVRRLLASSEPVIIDLTQAPGVTDHEFIEEQEKQLFALCTRTMTLPVGRGMFTLRTSIPPPTESMPIPKLCLTGKEHTKGATIDMQQIEFPSNMSLWPSFHNGVAAGLKISPDAREVDSTWIVYNKPKGQVDIPTEHAGFLMALGLNGHLKTLSFMSIYEYLVRCDEMTSVGLMLGIAATHRGTMDNTTTKLLSVHIEALLPATALELDIPQSTQVAALMGIGLLYEGTAKRHIAEVLLQEVGRPPGPEMENSVERESYALTAGLALGLVTLGKGESPAGLMDLQLADMLHFYMVGGNKRSLTGAQKEKYKLQSFQVREGDQVNLDVTAPGATLALALMFFNTNHRAVAEWMDPPNSRYLLDLVRPDFLLLRTLARSLIMWSDVCPDEEWLFNQFPANLRFDVAREATPAGKNNNSSDDEAITQAFCNIIAGAALSIGLKFAGSENPIAFKTLRRTLKMFLGFNGKYVGEHAGRTTIENCLMVILISLSLVFAGSGDIEILRIIRYLRSRIGPTHAHVSYGSHMAIHMSLGFLFLGAGRFTLAQTPEAVAALVCALFPKFPIHSNDNRYHLQAFRHLYVLAVEPRLFLPRDIDTRKLCLCNISVLELGSTEWRRLPMAPCMLPVLSSLQKVAVDDPNYWPVCFEKGRNWNQLLKALNNSACIDIKKRLGCLSYLEDPDRLKSLSAQTLTREQHICWDIDAKVLERFANETIITSFYGHLLHYQGNALENNDETKFRHVLTMLFYNAVVQDKIHVIPIYLEIFRCVQQFSKQAKTIDVFQMKLVKTYLANYHDKHVLISRELIESQVEQFKLLISNWFDTLPHNLHQLLASTDFDLSIYKKLNAMQAAQMVAVLIYYKLTPGILSNMNVEYGERDFTKLVKTLSMAEGITNQPETLYALIKILQAS